MKKFFAIALVVCLFAAATIYATPTNSATADVNVLVLQDVTVAASGTQPDQIVVETTGTAVLGTDKDFNFTITGAGQLVVNVTWSGAWTTGGTNLTMNMTKSYAVDGYEEATLGGANMYDANSTVDVSNAIVSCTAAGASTGTHVWTETCGVEYRDF